MNFPHHPIGNNQFAWPENIRLATPGALNAYELRSRALPPSARPLYGRGGSGGRIIGCLQ